MIPLVPPFPYVRWQLKELVLNHASDSGWCMVSPHSGRVWCGGGCHKHFTMIKIKKCLSLSYLMKTKQRKEYNDISRKHFENPSGKRGDEQFNNNLNNIQENTVYIKWEINA